MAKTSIKDASQVPDPLLPYNFDLVIPNIPGGGDGHQLQLRCQATAIPGLSIEEALVQLRGAELNYAGRVVYEHNLDVQYLEARDIKTRLAMLNWMYYARDIRDGSGSYKAEYSTIADLLLYDDKSNIVRTIRMFGLWPKRLQDAQLDSSNSNPVALTGSFSYDYFQDLEAK